MPSKKFREASKMVREICEDLQAIKQRGLVCNTVLIDEAVQKHLLHKQAFGQLSLIELHHLEDRLFTMTFNVKHRLRAATIARDESTTEQQFDAADLEHQLYTELIRSFHELTDRGRHRMQQIIASRRVSQPRRQPIAV